MSLISFGEFVLADDNFSGVELSPFYAFSQNLGYIQGGSNYPKFTGIQRNTKLREFVINSDNGSWYQQEWVLHRKLDLDSNVERKLKWQRRAENTIVECMAVVSSIVPDGNGQWIVTFSCTTDIMESSTPNYSYILGPDTAGDNLSGSVNQSGSIYSLPKIILTPQKAKTEGDTIFTQTAIFTELQGLDWVNVPYYVTINHSTLVSAGKSNSDGSDILVYVDGLQVDRQIVGANTTSCMIYFPLTVEANSQATVDVTYSLEDQVYQGEYYAEWSAIYHFSRMNGVDSFYPFVIQINHAALVSANKSTSQGWDIKVFVNGQEMPRKFTGNNTTTCNIWFPLPEILDDAVVVIATSRYWSQNLTEYANGAMDLTSNSNAVWTYTTPGISTLGNTYPGALQSLHIQVDTTYSGPTTYGTNSKSGTDPSVGVTLGSGLYQGNYVRFNAGGTDIYSIKFKMTHNNGTATRAKTRIIRAPEDDSTYYGVYTFPKVAVDTVIAYTEYQIGAAGTKYVALGMEKDGVLSSGACFADFYGDGTNELTLTLDSSKYPVVEAISEPTYTLNTELPVTFFNGQLSDSFGHVISINNLIAPTTWSPNENTLISILGSDDWNLQEATFDSNSVANPVDGELTAGKLIESSNEEYHLYEYPVIIDTDYFYTFRVRAKAEERSRVQLQLDYNSVAGAYFLFDLSTGECVSDGTYGTNPFSTAYYRIESSGDSWFSLDVIFQSTQTNINLRIGLDNGTTNYYTGDGSSGIDLYDAELTLGTTIAGSVVIDALNKIAYLLDRGGTEISNSSITARKTISISGTDDEWIIIKPLVTNNISWSETNLDQNGMLVTIESSDRWR